ncbi:MAG: histidine kinase [Hyphomicrobiaceae bacterium]
MPSLLRFLFFVGLISAVAYGGLFALSEFFEPQQRETRQTVPGVKIKR